MKAILQVLRTLSLGLAPALRALWRWVCAVFGQRDRPRTERCHTLTSPIVRVPDPLIYDQYYLWSLGLPFTWDNPDISIWLGGASGAPWLGGTQVARTSLQADTTYQVVARIWNNSLDAPVAGLPVAFSYLSFGVGVQSNPIGQTEVNLGVKGGPGQPALAVRPWTTPVVPGHYCIQVTLLPASDTNWFNNLGQENTQVIAAQSPAVSSFALRNDTVERQSYEFRTDSFQIVDTPPCPPTPETAVAPPRADLASRLQILAALPAGQPTPLPPGWRVTLVPERPVLAASEQTTMNVKIEPAPGFSGTQPVNIHAFRTQSDSNAASPALAGGVTFFVTAS